MNEKLKFVVLEGVFFFFLKVKKHCGKKKERRLPAFSPGSTMFSESLCFRVVKNRDCVTTKELKIVICFRWKTEKIPIPIISFSFLHNVVKRPYSIGL